ncbi:MAG: helix-turn-helix transcriptional regulator [Clostridia bacterium]|nr:helix-turn-helix transcriptional regulator [Clostridia bacterium]
MDIKKVGNQIAELRKLKGLTQSELGERLCISFQAVSKWERGETLPDTAILPDLANVLETTTDFILTGGERMIEYKGKIMVSDMIQGLRCLENMGNFLGNSNIIYRSAINGIDTNMNTEIEKAFTDDYAFEAFVAEAVIQNLNMGAYVDVTDVKNSLKYDHFKKIILDYCAKKGIK